MTKINIHEAKSRFSHYISLVEQGGTVIICRRNIKIAEIRPIEKKKPRCEIGKCSHKFNVPDSFFNSLPNTFLKSFNDSI